MRGRPGRPRPATGAAARVPPDDAAEPLLRVSGLVKDYRVAAGLLGRGQQAVSAVADVSFELAAGQTFGLVGESGSGKTSIARLLVGLERADAGAIVLGGTDLAALPARQLRAHRSAIQLMFQDAFASLDPRMRVGSVLREPLLIQKTVRRRGHRRQVARILDEVGLPAEAAGRYPREFSGGQRQRLALARALIQRPALIVADEPVSALDVSVQAQILNLMRKLQRQYGLSYLFISHDLSVVRYMADTIGVMYLGKLVEVGPAEDVCTKPAHPYTAGLIDAVPAIAGHPAAGQAPDGAPGHRAARRDAAAIGLPVPDPVRAGSRYLRSARTAAEPARGGRPASCLPFPVVPNRAETARRADDSEHCLNGLQRQPGPVAAPVALAAADHIRPGQHALAEAARAAAKLPQNRRSRRPVVAARLLQPVVAASLLVSAVRRKGPFDGAGLAGSEVPGMSTDMSVPRPRLPGLDVSDSALLAALLQQAPVGFAFIGLDGRLHRVNQVLAGLLGGSAAQPGTEIGGAWPADLAEAAAAAVRRVAAGDRPVPQTEHAVTGRADGSGTAEPRRWAFSWFPSKDGETGGVAAIAIETTRQHEAAEALRRSEERYRSLVQAGAQVVWVTKPDGEIAEDSPEWRGITGQTAEEYLSKGWLEAIHPDDRERVEAAWLDCTRSGKVFDSRYRVRSRTGSYRHYDVRAVPIERDGKIIEWMGASTDVTAQREAEEMRGRLTEQLSAAALRTARLQQATSMLAEALTVEQVVQVITEVGRSAIGAERSAVAILDTERLRLRTVNPAGLPNSPGAPGDDIPLTVISVMTLAITTRRPVLMESPEAMRGTSTARAST